MDSTRQCVDNTLTSTMTATAFVYRIRSVTSNWHYQQSTTTTNLFSAMYKMNNNDIITKNNSGRLPETPHGLMNWRTNV